MDTKSTKLYMFKNLTFICPDLSTFLLQSIEFNFIIIISDWLLFFGKPNINELNMLIHTCRVYPLYAYGCAVEDDSTEWISSGRSRSDKALCRDECACAATGSCCLQKPCNIANICMASLHAYEPVCEVVIRLCCRIPET